MAKEAIQKKLEEIKSEISDTTAELQKSVEKQQSEIEELGQAREETGQEVQKLNDRLEEQMAEFKSRINEVEKKAGRVKLGKNANSIKSLGKEFVESDAYKNYNVAGGGQSKKFVVDESASKFFTKDFEQLTGGSLNDVPGYLFQAERIDDFIRGPEREQRIRDLMNVVPTSSGAIEYVEETGFTNNAGSWEEPDSEETDVPEKNKSELEYEVKSINVKTLAHWIPATRTVIEDVAQLQNAIDNRLMYGLQLEEDNQLLYGAGTGGDIEGILTNENIQSYLWSDGEEGDTQLDAIRKAMTKALLAEYPIDGTILNHEDWEDIELLKGNDGHYIWVNVVEGGQNRLWRASVVPTNAIDKGDFLTGAFSLGANLYDRQQAGIRISDSHEDFFTKNMYAILGEERLALAILRPEAFVHGEFDEEPSA